MTQRDTPDSENQPWDMSMAEMHNVRILGSRSKVIVLGHGLGTDQSCWKHVVPHLMDNYRLVLYDLMGAGSTNTDNFSFSRYSWLHGYADDLLAILDELDISSCIYVGHSASGMIGALASIERPEVFVKLIFLSASPRYINDTEGYVGGFEAEELRQMFDAMQSNFQAWVLGFAPPAIGADMTGQAVQEFSRTLFSMRPDIALSVTKMIFESDMRAMLPLVSVPCHILQSSKDLAVPLPVAECMHKSLGGKSIVEIFPIHGHLPHLSSPDIVVPVLIDILQAASDTTSHW